MSTTEQRFGELEDRLRQRRRPTWILGLVLAVIAVRTSGCWWKYVDKAFQNPERTTEQTHPGQLR